MTENDDVIARTRGRMYLRNFPEEQLEGGGIEKKELESATVSDAYKYLASEQAP